MARKQYNSSADRRWQQRYERIQRRKEEEAFRREGVEISGLDAEVRMIQQRIAYEERLRREMEMERIEQAASYYYTYGQWLDSNPFPTMNRTTMDRELIEREKERCTDGIRASLDEAIRKGFKELVNKLKREYGYLFQELDEGDPTALDEFLGGFATTETG